MLCMEAGIQSNVFSGYEAAGGNQKNHFFLDKKREKLIIKNNKRVAMITITVEQSL